MRCFSTRAMKSAGVYRASADFAKCGFAEMKFSGWQWRFVKLQRPPPEIRIFLPARSERSRTATWRPRLPASIAQRSPAAPAPRTTASNLWTAVWGNGASRSSPVIITSLTSPKPAHIVIKSSPRFPACAAERSNSTKFAMTRIDFVDWTFRRVPATLWLRFSELNAEDAEKSHRDHRDH